MEETERECKNCHAVKPITAFARTGKARYRRHECGQCLYLARKAALGESASRDEKRNRTARELGLSLDEYLALIAEDCHVCGREATAERQNGVYVNRNTGLISGVVCVGCSQAIGKLGHDPERAKALITLLAYSIE